MKKLSIILICLTALNSCRKQEQLLLIENKQKTIARDYLSTEMSLSDFTRLDFDRTIVAVYDSGVTTVRVAFQNENLAEHFVALKLKNDLPEKGKIIALSGTLNGSIIIESLDRTTKLHSAVQNGFIRAFHMNVGAETILPVPNYQMMQEVIIVATYPPSGGISWSYWIDIMALLENGSGYWSNYYEGLDPLDTNGGGGGGGNGGNGNGGGSGGGVYLEPAMEVDYESQYADAAIDLQKYINCFAAVPDAGATCKMTIFADIPVNSDANKFFDWSNGSPGHVYIQFQKTNGNQTVSQNIGFYPVTGWKTGLTSAPIAGKFVDNQYHEMNASLEMNITPAQLQTGLIRMQYLAGFIQYDIDDYNCTDWALNVFNEVAHPNQRLDILRYDIPGGMAPAGTSTPQGIFLKLQERLAAGGPQAAGITIPYIGWAGASNGPCN